MFSKLFRKKQSPKPDPQHELAEWESNGRPSPPPHIVKQKAIEQYRQRYGLNNFVETGTYLGDMVEAMRERFQTIYSVELSKKLHRRVSRQFKQYKHIHLLQGDSADRLKEIVSQLTSPAIFWLDGHYSGGMTAMGEKECPVREELAAIFTSDLSHVILIDDARLFNGTHDYPDMSELAAIVQKTGRSYTIETTDDIIRVTPS